MSRKNKGVFKQVMNILIVIMAFMVPKVMGETKIGGKKMDTKDKSEIIKGASWIGNFSGLLVEELEKLGMPFDDIYKLGKPTEKGNPLVRACAEKIVEVTENSQIELKLISGNYTLILNAADGSEILVEKSDLFAYIDPDSSKCDEKGSATEETPVVVYEMANKDSTLTEMYGSLTADVSKLCLTQAQIIGFVKQYRDWFGRYKTFFLFKSNNNLFVAGVSVRQYPSSGGLGVIIYPFNRPEVFYVENRHRLVSPQQLNNPSL
jgi:hypothetical protein